MPWTSVYGLHEPCAAIATAKVGEHSNHHGITAKKVKLYPRIIIRQGVYLIGYFLLISNRYRTAQGDKIIAINDVFLQII